MESQPNSVDFLKSAQIDWLLNVGLFWLILPFPFNFGSTGMFRGSKKCSIDNSFPTTTFSIVLYWSEWGWNQSPLVVDNCQQRRWQLPTIWMATANNLNGNCQQSALPSSEGQRDKGQRDGHMPPTSWTATVRAPPPAFDRLCCHGKYPLSP